MLLPSRFLIGQLGQGKIIQKVTSSTGVVLEELCQRSCVREPYQQLNFLQGKKHEILINYYHV